MKINCLEDLRIYQTGIDLVAEIYLLCKNSYLRADFSLVDQIKRASVSVVANIAEGFGRRTKKDFCQFLSISLGSTNEIMAFLDIIAKIYPKITTVSLKEKYRALSKQIFSFRRTLIS